MVIANGSNGLLANLYSSFCGSKAHNVVIDFLERDTQDAYNGTSPSLFAITMPSAISAWMSALSTLQSVGLTNQDSIPGLRVQVIMADGKTAYDSNSNNNSYANINVPAANFSTTGKYLINENQNSRIYNMAAALSTSGVSHMLKYSNSVGVNQRYIAVRQGSQTEPLGNIVISMNDA